MRIFGIFMICAIPAWLHAQKPTFGVQVIGQGKPMILIPGLKGDGPETFASTVAHYKDHYTCYVITLAGFAGQPPSARQSDLLKGQRDDILEYIRQEHLQKPILLGFSFGGSLALWMASTEPSLFGPVIDLDGAPCDAVLETPNTNMDSLRKITDQHLSNIQHASPEMIARRDSMRNTPAVTKQSFEFLKSLITDTTKIPMVIRWDRASDMRASTYMSVEMDKVDVRDSIANIQSPILFLGSWKGYEKLKTRKEVESAIKNQFAKAPHTRIVFSAEGRHFFMWDDFNWMTGAIDKFLASTAR